MNTGAAFGFLLRGRPCKPFNSDQRIHIPATGLYTYPDGGVVRGQWEYHPSDEMSLELADVYDQIESSLP